MIWGFNGYLGQYNKLGCNYTEAPGIRDICRVLAPASCLSNSASACIAHTAALQQESLSGEHVGSCPLSNIACFGLTKDPFKILQMCSGNCCTSISGTISWPHTEHCTFQSWLLGGGLTGGSCSPHAAHLAYSVVVDMEE